MERRFFVFCAVILILVGVLVGCGKTGQEPVPVSAWPMFHCDLQHTGRSPHAGPQTDVLEWLFRTDGAIGFSPAIAKDGTVYVGSGDGYLYAIDPDGTLKWKFETDDWVESSPAIAKDETVYIGSDDGHLYAIDPDGTLKWKFETGDWVMSSPAIAKDEIVYVGSDDGHLYAIKPDGTLKWKFETDDQVLSSPAIAKDGTVYVGSEDGYLYAINPAGTLKWKFETGDQVLSSPAIAKDGIVYVGSDDNYLYALKPNGTLKWKFETGDWVESSPAIAKDGTVYVGSADSYLYAINPDGTLKWKFETGNWVRSSPAIAKEGIVYVGSGDGYLYAVGERAGASQEQPSSTHTTRSTTGADIEKVAELIKKENEFFNEGNWEGLYKLHSPKYRSACSYPKFAELQNAALASLRLAYPQGEAASTNIEVTVKGRIAYATYVVRVGENAVHSLTKGTADVFINYEDTWYDIAEDPSDPGYNEEDAKVERDTVVWQVPKEFPTIQSAIDAARSGVTVLVSQGVYKENLEIRKPITLKAAGKVVIQAADTGKDVVSLQCISLLDRLLKSVVLEGDLILDGLVLEGGRDGLYVDDWSALTRITLKDCAIQNNAKRGIYVYNTSEVRLIGCVIQHNRDYGVALDGYRATFTNCTITDNKYGIGDLDGWIGDTIEGSNNRIYGNRVKDLVPEEGWPTGF